MPVTFSRTPFAAHAIIVVLIGVDLGCTRPSQRGTDQAAAGDTTGAREFVQQFYDWYTPIATSRIGHPSEWEVLSVHDRYLHPTLYQFLRDDSVASATHSQTRKVIDFDAFLDSQDPCSAYRVSDVTSEVGYVRVRVTPVCANATQQHWQSARPVIQLVAQAGRWKIADVLYDRGPSLKALLCQYRKEDSSQNQRLPRDCP
jgi:hypothetical protein